jgi:cytosine deaminase
VSGLPSGGFTLRNASVPSVVLNAADDGTVLRLDIDVADGRIAGIRPADGPPPAGAVHNMDGGLVLPAFVDLHTHLDKGHIWQRQPNPDGSFMGALLSVADDRNSRWSAEDVAARMDFALRCAYAHGTAAIRTHLDSERPQGSISWPVFEEMRARWANRIELQAVSLVGPDCMLDPDLLRRVGQRVKSAGGRFGGAIAAHPRSAEAMRNMVAVAGELGLDLDLHCDESGDPAALSLRHLAEAVLEAGYRGRVAAGHCCSLAVQDERMQAEIIELVAEAGIAIVSLPLCNLYLQDRDVTGTRTPGWRGVTLLRELRAAGVAVAVASDNTRDPFYAYGDLDAVEVFREAARILHFDHPQPQAWGWIDTLTTGAAAIGGFEHKAEIAVGAPADLVLFRARDWTELLSRPQSDRIVLRHGTAIDTTLPDYRELDQLME